MSEPWTRAMADAHNARVSKENRIPKMASDCCNAKFSVSKGDKGTQCYVCEKCGQPTTPRPEKALDACEDESELHAEILQECRRRGWLALHGSMAHKSKRTLGEFDFTIIREKWAGYREPSVLFIEAKARAGKLTPAQLALHAHARKLGHGVYIVRSMVEFLRIL